jgi:folate-dependent tRNA-U54 methylase TrmFO/GidA
MNANFGLVEPLETPVKDKAKKKEALVERAMRDIDEFADQLKVLA